MSTPLRVLVVEDSEDDAELLSIQLRRAGFEVEAERVDTAAAFSAALDRQSWDLILSDHSMPTFDAPRALAILKERHVDLPFIVLSGTIRQEVAVELMRAGAHDFVPKDDAARLEPVVRRELREAENRRARHQAEAQREQLIAELEAANRSKDEFLAMLGHELRNPLAPIVTALHLMKMKRDGHPSPEQEVIERQVRHLLRLVDDLLDVAKIARGKVQLSRRVLELAAVVAKATEIASPLLEERHHQFTVKVPAQGLLVDVDEQRLSQVISNLLTNAARYTPPGGQIVLEARAEADEVVLTVKDNGVGIDAATLPTIFDMFVQGARPLDRGAGGLGIGLAVVYNLVTLHGGSVTANSAGRDQGSEFTVRLPLAERPRHPTPAALPAVTPPPAGQRMLLVDDNQDAVDTLADMMRLQGFEVEVAYDGPSALHILERFTPSVMVLDIGLPVMDGFELARQIRARPQHRGALLIALTGYGQATDRERSLAAGFDQHLVKPIEIAQLLAVVAEFKASGR